jgi:PPOX class F420-dependent enzyme/OxyR family protein/uncharacterized protein (TIGR02246 family)
MHEQGPGGPQRSGETVAEVAATAPSPPLTALDPAHLHFLSSHRHAYLATVAPNGTPHNKPVGYRYNPELGTIDIAGIGMEGSAKYRNVGLNPDVALVIDDLAAEGRPGGCFLEVRGRATQEWGHEPPSAGLSPRIIRIRPRRIVSWNVDPAQPGLRTYELGAHAADSSPARPALGEDAATTGRARNAVARFVAELQAGLDRRDADLYNRHFAADLIWGSPFGAVVTGYDQLHAIHARLLREARGGPRSRYEIAAVLAPGPDIALAHVRRVALDEAGEPVAPSADASGAFSELALYVLIRRRGRWWLAAGQNAPVRAAE